MMFEHAQVMWGCKLFYYLYSAEYNVRANWLRSNQLAKYAKVVIIFFKSKEIVLFLVTTKASRCCLSMLKLQASTGSAVP